MKKLNTFIFLSIALGFVFTTFGCSHNSNIQREPSSTPNSQKILTSNLDRPTNLLMTYVKENETSILDVYSAIYEINRDSASRIRFRLFYPEAFVAIGSGGSTDGMSPKREMEKLKKKILRQIGKSDALKYFSDHPHKYLSYSWIQDLGEPYWEIEGDNIPKISFLDVNPRNHEQILTNLPLKLDEITDRGLGLENPDDVLAAVNSLFQFKTRTRMNSYTSDGVHISNQGGNIEVLPNRRPYIGNTAPPEMVRFISSALGQTPLVLRTDFLTVGHVDEIFSFIPSTKSTCGYALVAADPMWGAALLAEYERSGESFRDSMSAFLKRGRNLDLSIPIKLAQFDLNKSPRKYGTGSIPDHPRFFDWLIHRSIHASIAMEENIELLRKALFGSCNDLQVIRVPVKTGFGSEADFSALEPADVEANFSTFSPSTPNMVVLGENLILPAPQNIPSDFQESFRSTTVRQLMTAGIKEEKIRFIDATFYFNGMGSIHCGSMVMRRPK